MPVVERLSRHQREFADLLAGKVFHALEITPTEEACGVTVAKVLEEIQKARMTGDGMLLLRKGTPPALCQAVARYAFGWEPEFVGLRHGYPAYWRDDDYWPEDWRK